MKKLLPLIVTLIVSVAAAYGMWQLTARVNPPVEQAGEVQIGGPFHLINQDGKAVSDSDYKGKLMLVYFGFTYCPDICPTDLGLMAQAMQQLNSDEVVPVFITIDPERDTEAQLKSYLSNFKTPIVGLTGDRAAIDDAIKTYRVYAQKVPNKEGTDYTMDHSAFMYLMGRDGKYLTHFGHNTPPSEIATKIREYL